MWRTIHCLIVAAFVAALVGVPLFYAKEQRSRSRNFRVVTPDVLYRCGQLNKAGLERIVFDYGIRTVVSLRAHDGIEHASRWEEDYCLIEGLAFARLPMSNWLAGESGEFPLPERAQEFMRIMADPKRYPRPVLLHCFAGMHRTGALTAVYRMEFEGWTNDQAIAELAECGYPELEDNIGGFLRGYRPAPAWGREPMESGPATMRWHFSGPVPTPPWVSERLEGGYHLPDGTWVSKP